MKKTFATSFAFLAAFYTKALGEGNFSAIHEEESDSFLLSSGNLGLLNNEMSRLQSEVKAGNEAYEALGSQHATESAAKDATIAELQEQLAAKNTEIATLQGKTPAAGATSTGEGADPAQGGNNSGLPDYCDPNASHNKYLISQHN